MKKIISLIISSCFIFSFFTVPVFAKAFTCEEVSTSESGFFVILEEVVSMEVTDNSRPCFRVCEKKVQANRVCKIQTKCEAISASDFDCQRIQVLRADSGAELVYSYVGMIYKWAAGTIGIISVFTIVYSGIGIMASGEGGSMDKHKTRIMQSLLGLVILFLSGIILYTINPTFFV
ncbi:hypothetical protein ACFL3C_02805 [Patescibacteria group bacterium]